MGIVGELKENFEREKARLEGKARSQAKLFLQAKDIPSVAAKLKKDTMRPAQPTGVAVRMSDGKPMMIFDDGSFRHAVGRHITKAARKALKKARRVAAAHK